MLNMRRQGLDRFLCWFILGALFLTFFGTTLTCEARPIPTNIPRNKLSEADATYLLMKDTNPNWINAEVESQRETEALAVLTPAEFDRAPIAPYILRGDDTRKEVAFTFDDGPHAAYTSELISILLQYHVPATMFLVGTQCERYPYLVREEQADGFTIGNHTYHHFSLTKIPPQYVGPELLGCGDVIRQITGKTPTLFRPPGGDYSPIVAHMAARLGYTTVLWTVDPGDFDKPSASVILARTLAKTSNGAIFLFHDGIPETMEALPLIIEYLRTNGYQIIPLEQMMRERTQRESNWLNELRLAKFTHPHPIAPPSPEPIEPYNARE